MFHSPPSSESPQKPPDISATSAIGILAFIVIAVFSMGKGQEKLDRFYFEYFTVLHYAGFILAAVTCATLVWFILKSTKELSARKRLIGPVSKPGSGVLSGTTGDGVRLYVPTKTRLGHVQIIGATGRGKTESVILPWLVRDLGRGHSAILIDGKGDPELSERIRGAAECLKMPAKTQVFDLGNPRDSMIINPLSHGSPQQITDRIFTAFNFTQEFYKSVQYDICLGIISLIHETSGQRAGAVTFRRLFELLTDINALSELLADSKNEMLRYQISMFLSESPLAREKNTKGLVSQISPFAIGEISDLVNGVPENEDSQKFLSISDLVLAKQSSKATAQVFLISTLLYQDIGHQLGKLLLQELSWAVGQRASRTEKEAPFLPVYLDEFAAFVYPGFTNVLNKARSSGVALHLSHQSLGDLAVVSPEFATIVNTNTNVKCLFGLNDPETADFFARHIGTSKDEKMTERAQKQPLFGGNKRTGEMSVREVESYKVHPNDLKNFTTGQGVLYMPSPRGNITEVIQFSQLSSKESCFA